jgi:hypothetical protein
MSNPNPVHEPRPAGARRRPGAVNHLTTARVKTECKVRAAAADLVRLNVNAIFAAAPAALAAVSNETTTPA